MHLKTSSAKQQPFYLGLNVLSHLQQGDNQVQVVLRLYEIGICLTVHYRIHVIIPAYSSVLFAGIGEINIITEVPGKLLRWVWVSSSKKFWRARTWCIIFDLPYIWNIIFIQEVTA